MTSTAENWKEAVLELMDGDKVLSKQTGSAAGAAPYNEGWTAAKKALENREKPDFVETVRECPKAGAAGVPDCRCPRSRRPEKDDPRWSKDADPQPCVTKFDVDTPNGKLHYRAHFVANEFTLDVVQKCKPKEREVSWFPSDDDLLAIGPSELDKLIERHRPTT
jgi:hypothetical protein